MRDFVLLVPTGPNVGLTTISLGLVRAFERRGVHVEFLKPIAQPRPGYNGPERSTALIRATTRLTPPEPISLHEAEQALRSGEEQRLLETIVERMALLDSSAEIVVVEGLVPTAEVPFATHLNQLIARAIDADVCVVAAPDGTGPHGLVDSVRLAIAELPRDRLAGVVVNKIPLQAVEPPPSGSLRFGTAPPPPTQLGQEYADALDRAGFECVGLVPRRELFAAPRVADVARELRARVIKAGDLSRRVVRFRLAAAMVPRCLAVMEPWHLVLTPGDRNDVIMAACLAVLGGIPLAGLLLTGGVEPDPRVLELGSRAFDAGLPVLLVEDVTLEAANALLHVDREVPIDDVERIELVMNAVADELDRDWVMRVAHRDRPRRLSPPAFRHLLIERARKANRRIVLPEGTEPRTVRAAIVCQERGIARCVLLGNVAQIRRVAADQGLTLPAGLELVDPQEVFGRYVEPMLELRRHKGLTETEARNQLHDEVVLGTMMLAVGDVDGLVSGAVHTTADTVRPALQLVKTAPGMKLVSSIFFMCLPEQVLVYGDCAINPDPTAEELADIAVQSAASAEAFGIEPKVALISYSTGASGAGKDVDKVRRATELARERRPDLLIDGPLQYDAAVMPDVGRSKAPNSAVAGRASVLVFPDLNTGNTTYKAVQRSANVISIGPMLQGLAKPVNDLSRGALVDDIVYTIALTAIQSTID